MEPLNEMIVVAITNFNGTSTSDKNGKYPVMLNCIAGTMPNRNVLSGTVAENLGIEVGKSYLMQVRETGFDKLFGRDFTFVKIRELESADDTVRTCKDLGKPNVIRIDKPDGFKDHYERQGNAIEGIRTKRAKEGLYKFVEGKDLLHETAKDVKDGSSNEKIKPLNK